MTICAAGSRTCFGKWNLASVSVAKSTRLSDIQIPENGDVEIIVEGTLVIDRILDIGRERELHLQANFISGKSKYWLKAKIVRFTTNQIHYLGCINADKFESSLINRRVCFICD